MICLFDPEGYVEARIILSPVAFFIATQLDGQNDVKDIQLAFARRAGGTILPSDGIRQLVAQLDEQGFLVSERFAAIQAEVRNTFAQSPARPAYAAGKSYPDEPGELRAYLDEFFDADDGPAARPDAPGNGPPPRGLIAPHIDFGRGGRAYAHAYGRLYATGKPRKAVIFGVAHKGGSTPFILTRKDFDRGLRYMRLRGDLGTVGRTRWNNWRSAVKEVNEAPIMGKGFSSRWVGESGNLRGGKRGIRYDFTSDPHNVWLTLAKSVGVPGAVLFACFLFGWTRLAWACHRQALIRGARIAVPSLWTALMAWAVVAGLFENVLLSFGAVGDRFAWVALGLLTCPHPAAARPKRPRSRRRKADASRDELGVAP